MGKFQLRDRWEILANYKIQRVPQQQIAEVLGVSEGLISQEVTSEEFQAFYTEHLKKHASLTNEFDDGWDALEKVAVGNLLETIQYIKDPKFNLQIAMVANKAQRRQSRFNHPLDAAAAGAQPVVVQLRTTFINKVQIQNNHGAGDAEDVRAGLLGGNRSMNIPSPHRIEQVFSNPLPATLEEQAEAMLADVKVG